MELGSLSEWIGAVASIVATLISIWALKESREASSEVQKLELRKQELDEKIHQQRMDFDRERTEWEHQASIAARKQQQRFQALQSRWQDEAAHRDEDRRKRQAVAGVSAWWACKREKDGDKWGLVIVNEGPYAGPITDILIAIRSKFGHSQYELNFLPPGQYFAKSNRKERYEWDFPEIITPREHISPITKSKDYSVDALSCKDPLGTPWCWTPQTGWYNPSA